MTLSSLPRVNPADADAIALVVNLGHRIGSRRNCKCEECKCLRRVVALAREAVAMKIARRSRKASLPNAPYSKYGRRTTP